MKRLLLLALVGLIPAVLGSDADADAGIGITTGKIQINDKLKPGGRYALPSVGVLNTGDEKQAYEVLVSYLDEDGTRRPPQRWLKLEPRQFVLNAGETQQVDISLALPGSAEPGAYFALIEAQMVSDNGPSVQASVGSKLSFTVGESGWLETLRRQINNQLDDFDPWWYVLPIAGVLAAFLRLSRRWVRFKLPFELR